MISDANLRTIGFDQEIRKKRQRNGVWWRAKRLAGIRFLIDCTKQWQPMGPSWISTVLIFTMKTVGILQHLEPKTTPSRLYRNCGLAGVMLPLPQSNAPARRTWPVLRLVAANGCKYEPASPPSWLNEATMGFDKTKGRTDVITCYCGEPTGIQIVMTWLASYNCHTTLVWH